MFMFVLKEIHISCSKRALEVPWGQGPLVGSSTSRLRGWRRGPDYLLVAQPLGEPSRPAAYIHQGNR